MELYFPPQRSAGGAMRRWPLLLPRRSDGASPVAMWQPSITSGRGEWLYRGGWAAPDLKQSIQSGMNHGGSYKFLHQ